MRMEDNVLRYYLKKVLCLAFFYIFTDVLFYNVDYFIKNGSIIRIGFDALSVAIYFGSFLLSFLFVLAIKLLSKRIDKFIYESNTMIIYIAICLQSFTGLYVLLFKTIEKQVWLLGLTITLGYSFLIVYILYKFWKYRLEITLGLFLTRVMFTGNGFIIEFYKTIGVKKPNDFLQGISISTIFVIFILLSVFLQKKGVYDFRSRKDKWLESVGQGPYKN